MSTNNTESDTTKLIIFLDKLEERLNYFLKERAKLYFETQELNRRTNENVNLMRLLVTAWEETRPRFKDLKNSIQSRDYAGKLKLVGLTGPELKLKLLVVDESYDDLQIEEEKFGFYDERTGRGSGLRFWHKLMKLKEKWEKYLDFADTILGSLSSAGLPGADAISELKETVEKLLSWWKTRKRL